MEGKRIELAHLDREYYKTLHYKQLYGYSSELWIFDPAPQPMEIDPDLSRRQAMNRIQKELLAKEQLLERAMRDFCPNFVINKIKNEIRALETEWDNLHRQEPRQWSPVEQRPQQEQTEKCVIYYIGGPWDMVKKVEEKKPNDAVFVDVVEHASFWDGKQDTPKTQKATYRLQRLQTTVPICDGLPVFAAVYKGLADDDIPF